MNFFPVPEFSHCEKCKASKIKPYQIECRPENRRRESVVMFFCIDCMRDLPNEECKDKLGWYKPKKGTIIRAQDPFAAPISSRRDNVDLTITNGDIFEILGG